MFRQTSCPRRQTDAQSAAAASPIDPRRVAERSSSEGRFQLKADNSAPRVRFARPVILFYDAHRIALFQLICALYLMREDKATKEIAHIWAQIRA